MLDDLTRQIVAFRDERDWKQFHSPKNLAASISIEAAELLECFQWSSDETIAEDVEKRRSEIEEEIADVLIYALLLAHDTGINPAEAVQRKLAKNEAKYPAEKAKGSRAKYTEL
ncbi:MAG TPA: nucleotide pyrophosphohydrolase [Coriobacteriia bacterium]|nr:MAG: MazG nucleotide pyrophosphohydrolase [Actinobacteria bacterium 66_15]HAL30684.1 nucleotide pyrophosphohydrolase [Coriobacteriia bacterium]